MSALWSSDKVEEWVAVWHTYEDEVKRTGKDGLVDNDKWLRETLPADIAERDSPHITQPELCRIMEWKLSRGKFRPRLQQFVASLSPKVVKETSTRSFAALRAGKSEGALSDALKVLCELKGVGPATASLILSAFDESVPFMADEALAAVPGLGPIQYTHNHCLKFAKALRKRAKELNAVAKSASAASSSGDSEVPKKSPRARAKKTSKGDGVPSRSSADDFPFTAHRISQCLWSSVISKKVYKPKKKKKGVAPKASSSSTAKSSGAKRNASKKRATR